MADPTANLPDRLDPVGLTVSDLEGWTEADCDEAVERMTISVQRQKVLIGLVLWKRRSLTVDDRTFGLFAQRVADKTGVTMATLLNWRKAAETEFDLPAAIEPRHPEPERGRETSRPRAPAGQPAAPREKVPAADVEVVKPAARAKPTPPSPARPAPPAAEQPSLPGAEAWGFRQVVDAVRKLTRDELTQLHAILGNMLREQAKPSRREADVVPMFKGKAG